MNFAADVEFQLIIDGVDRTGLLEPSSLEIEQQLGARGSCDLLLNDESLSVLPDVGDSVYVLHHGARLFAGTIESRTMHVPGDLSPGKIRTLDISCVDFNQLADRFHVNATYEGKTAREIILDIVTVQTRLWEEGVTLGDVQDGVTFARATFPLVRVSDALKDLAEASGYAWTIDNNKVLHFFERAAYQAPFSITDTSKNYKTIGSSASRGQYRNRQWLKAGNDLTDARPEKSPGDGETRTFPLAYDFGKFATAPDGSGLTPSVAVDGLAQRVGVKGKDKDGQGGTAQWFYQTGEREITQRREESLRGDATASAQTLSNIQDTKGVAVGDPIMVEGAGPGGSDLYTTVSSFVVNQSIVMAAAASTTVTGADIILYPPLRADQEILVTYHGLFPILVEAQLDAEIGSRKLAEGGTGIYEHREDDDQVDGRDFATEKVDRLLALYGRIPNDVPITLQYAGLSPGQLLPVNVAQLGLSGDFLVDAVRLSSLRLDPVVFDFEVTALDGDHRENWVEFFRRSAAAGRKFSIRENETFLVSRPATSGLAFGEIITDSAGDPPATLRPYTDDPYTFARIGLITVGGATVAGFVMGRSRIGKPHGL